MQEVQGTAATGGTDQGEPRKDNELNEVDFDIRNSDREGNVQFVHTRVPLNNIPSNTTPSTLSSTSSANINSITLVTTSDVGLPISTANTSSTQMTTETTTEYYRGYPLNLKALLGKFGDGVLSQYYERSRVSTQNRQKARVFVKCCICGEFEEEAKRFSANGRVYMAQGVRCDGKKKIQDVIDHLLGPSHRAAQEKKQLSKLWNAKDKRHPFINLATKSDPTVLKTLTEMAVEVYNDSKSLTLAAWSWPGRSLANLHAQQQFRSLTDSDNVQSFTPFKPSGEELHYRDPMHYAEMLEIIGDTERKHLREELQNCICFAAQMDGSVDARQQDKKFIFVRFNTPEDPLSIKTRFASARESTKRGPEGLCSAMTNCFDDMGLSKECLQSKFVGMSTDGESANTGKDSGLWARVENYVGRSTRNIWCACHRSDLAMEDVMRLVPELKIWLSNVTGVATYYRTSGLRTKELKTIKPDMRSFPPHHEVRFAQHLVQLCGAILFNLDGCLKHWQKICDAPREYNTKEVSSAKGFLKLWQPTGVQAWLTAVMVDTCCIFRYIEKEAQKPGIIIPDILKYRDTALQKLDIMQTEPYPGGQEELLTKKIAELHPENDEAVDNTPRRTHNTNVTTFRRGKQPIRQEVIDSSRNFLQTRLNEEQTEIVTTIINLTSAKRAIEFINIALPQLESSGISDKQAFIDAVLENFTEMLPDTHIPARDYGVRLYQMLRGSKQPVTKFLSGFCVLCPHSMTVERCVSTYNMLFSNLRMATSEKTLNDRLLIHWNGVPTSQFDPSPMVQEFLQKKQRRMNFPNLSSYAERDFVKKFFTSDC
ncbi:Hypothetical predicted protein [Paramuricea clavata]|uniref:Uncharacterized protein n=1 Tax=Paramuricea clavata TaxID=317549 RepID=A0A7D9E4Q3_PARCT|nr:Hypothetical predicted protein [Paramuricea clavata]